MDRASYRRDHAGCEAFIKNRDIFTQISIKQLLEEAKNPLFQVYSMHTSLVCKMWGCFFDFIPLLWVYV